MDIVSKSPLRYFQMRGMGRYGAACRDGMEDPFRYGQVMFEPRLGTRLNTVEKMISKPCAVKAEMRRFY